MGVVEGELKGRAMTAPAEGPAKEWAAEAVYDQGRGRMASLATGDAGKLPIVRLGAGLSGHEVHRRPQGRGVGVDRGALRWPWARGSGEAQLGLGSGGREGWGLGAGAQMVEEPASADT